MKSFMQYYESQTLSEISQHEFSSSIGDVGKLSADESEQVTKLISAATKFARKSPLKLLHILKQTGDDEIVKDLEYIDVSALKMGSQKIDQPKDEVVPPASDTGMPIA